MKTVFLETIGNTNFVITKSDYILLQNETNIEYVNPIDIGEYDVENNMWKPKYYSYTETANLIPQEPETQEQLEEVEIIE